MSPVSHVIAINQQASRITGEIIFQGFIIVVDNIFTGCKGQGKEKGPIPTNFSMLWRKANRMIDTIEKMDNGCHN